MDKELFIEELKKINIDINDDQLNKLETYYNFLVEYNKNVNLTRILDKDEVYSYRDIGYINDLKKIRNYQYDNMCTDYLRSLRKERNNIYNEWERLLGLPIDERCSYDISGYASKENKIIDGLYQTLLYLKSRAPIKNPY